MRKGFSAPGSSTYSISSPSSSSSAKAMVS